MSIATHSSPNNPPSSASASDTRLSDPQDSSASAPPTSSSPAMQVPPPSAPPTASSPPAAADAGNVPTKPAGGVQAENVGEVEEDVDDIVDDAGPKGRGKPSNFTGQRLLAMQKGLKDYMALKTRKERKKFWPTFMAELMEEFPLSMYPIPKSRLTSRESFVEKTDAEIEALTPADKTAYEKSRKAAKLTDEELYLQMVKDWIFWQQTCARKSEGGLTGVMFRAELEKKKKQVKPRFNQWVMKHDRYKGQVVSRSSETGRLDRLQSRADAVKDVLLDLPEDDMVALREEYDAMIKALDVEDDDEGVAPDVAEQRRHNFGPLAQEVLNIWRKLTGLNMTLLAGECLDGDTDYDSCVVFAKPDDCVDMDECEGVDFDRFSNTFLMWLKTIHSKTNPGSNRTAQSASVVSLTTPTPSVPKLSSAPDPASNSQAPSNIPTTTARQRKGGKQKGKKAAIGDEEMSEVETTEPSDPSDMGSESEDDRVDVGREVTVVRAPVDSTGLWEKNEEGLPELKVAMRELTREQQAAFRHECASALGLTKAVEELKEDIQRSKKTKNSSGSRHRGSKPTRRSERIQATEERRGEETEEVHGPVDDEAQQIPMSGRGADAEGDNDTSGKEVVVEGSQEMDAPPAAHRLIPSIDNVEILPAWVKAVVNGHAQLDMPHMEGWAQFDITGCSTPFLREYGGWLLGPKNKKRPEAWSVVVYKWIELEELWNHAQIVAPGAQVKLMKNRRPNGYLQWFKYGRLRWEELVPSEVQPETLAKEWWVWWSRVVNPRWRPRAEDMVMPGGNGSWEAVRMPGKDGFVLLLVSLRWWCDLLDRPGADCLWLATLKSVYWTLEELQKDARSFTEEGESGADDEHDEAVEGNKRTKTQWGGRDRKHRRR
ncbi:SERTA domain-containing protein 3 [Paramarasmius palmivorus]|uniref:SERTA domain-containing protein 3 n=1 Tax=Paramarasmius palmivorus TaxID=297713 RepID=A0AAW0B1S5_9AGAR